ncbi:MAG: Na+/H+ antiporter NhaA [Gemmatimonadales bacterium]
MPPEVWHLAGRLTRTVKGSLDRFLHIEAAGGIVLIVAAAVALAWANSPWSDLYEALWHTPITIGLGSWRVEESLHFWINDLLMTVFFLLVGLEIKREIVEGALSDMRRAALPIAGALGGMLFPAAIYIAINSSGGASQGWGVPMATDIAFAVGVLTLLGKRVPATLRVLLLALAIIDDVGAILVIALFYSSGFAFDGLAIAAAGVLLLFVLLKMGVRSSLLFAITILIIWTGMLRSGIHPTIAGVIAGLCAPARSWFGKAGFLEVARSALDDFQSRVDRPHTDHELIEPLSRLAQARREALSPALRLETALHPWVAYLIMPVFALANAGIHMGGLELGHPDFSAVVAGVMVGLVLGKPLGILLVSWIAVRLRLCALPEGVSWGGMLVVGSVAGIGFTMAIFISELAFQDAQLLELAKLSVLLATALAAAIGLLAGRVFLQRQQPGSLADVTASDAELSAEYWTDDSTIPNG